uniref:Snurportin-1 n=1 Tax=Panagrellus redivivus TaxID=6233 RepID=A0A7E4W1W6_PANRE
MTSDPAIDALTAAFNVDTGLSDDPVFAEHPRFSGYKNVGRAAQRQKERRQEYLERQKEQRAEAHDRARAMFDDDYFEEEEEAADGTGEEAMEADEVNAFKTHQRPKLHRRYQDQLMFSEWLIDIPNELHETWAMMACPKGKRCLVVAKDGWTQAFNKAGLLIFESMTGLPVGCSASRHSTTIVGAIRLAADPQTYYILDKQ